MRCLKNDWCEGVEWRTRLVEEDLLEVNNVISALYETELLSSYVQQNSCSQMKIIEHIILEKGRSSLGKEG